jgi:hypothetical protein
MPLALVRGIKEAESQLVKLLLYSVTVIVKVLGFTSRLLAIHYPEGRQGKVPRTCPRATPEETLFRTGVNSRNRIIPPARRIRSFASALSHQSIAGRSSLSKPNCNLHIPPARRIRSFALFVCEKSPRYWCSELQQSSLPLVPASAEWQYRRLNLGRVLTHSARKPGPSRSV